MSEELTPSLTLITPYLSRRTVTCDYHSCIVVGPNVAKFTCYAPKCDREFHSFLYDVGVLRRNCLEHFDTANTEHPFLHIACKKECYNKARRHYGNRSGNPEDRNIPWNRHGKEGENGLNNSENILLTWIQQPNNYAKFRSPA
jgi:hypothetical protein